MSKRKTKAMAAQFARECEQDPQRPGSRLRKNADAPKKRTDQEDNFVQGMALALAELNRKFDQPTEVAEVLRDAGLDDLDKLRKAGVDQYDLDELAKCLPSTPDPDWRKGAKQRATRLCAKRMSRATGHNIIAKDVE